MDSFSCSCAHTKYQDSRSNCYNPLLDDPTFIRTVIHFSTHCFYHIMIWTERIINVVKCTSAAGSGCAHKQSTKKMNYIYHTYLVSFSMLSFVWDSNRLLTHDLLLALCLKMHWSIEVSVLLKHFLQGSFSWPQVCSKQALETGFYFSSFTRKSMNEFGCIIVYL